MTGESQKVWTYNLAATITYEVYADTEEEADVLVDAELEKQTNKVLHTIAFEHNPTEGREKYGSVRTYVAQNDDASLQYDGVCTVIYPRTEEEIANLTPEEEAERQAQKALGYEVD